MNFYCIEPDAPGRVEEGRNIYENHSKLDSVIFIFDYWPDDIVESTPVFLASERLSKRISDAGTTGFLLKMCKCIKGDQFHISCPERGDIPPYRWLDVTGKAGVDDFGLENLNLVVSQRALDILKNFDISLADITPFVSNRAE